MKKTFKITCPECFNRPIIGCLIGRVAGVKFDICQWCKGKGYLKYEIGSGRLVKW